MRGYVLTVAAREDMRDIWQYTFQTWGRTQANRYARQLEHCFAQIASGSLAGRPLPDERTIRSVRCEHHYVFFEAEPTQVVILAVLHERMDLTAQLQSRLGD